MVERLAIILATDSGQSYSFIVFEQRANTDLFNLGISFSGK